MANRVLPRRYASPTLVARGGMAEVYRATDEVLGRTVAVKLLAERHAREPEIRARFGREAQAAARLSGTRHVITVFDVGEHGGRPFIVMENLDGGSLHDRLRKGRVGSELALAWLEQAAQALDQAHARGVVHRDVKPANLLLDADGNVHVSDFGIASAGGFDTLTLPGTVLGTAGYLSPEQARGEPATAASDRYALGVVAFELLTGRRPYEAETAATEAFAHVNAPVPSATELEPALPREVDRVVRSALAKDPSERPVSASELVDRLREALLEKPRPTRVQTRPSRSRAGVAVHRSRRRPGVLVLGAVGLLLATAAILSVTLGLGDDAGGGSARADTTPRSSPTVRQPDGAALNDTGFARMQAGDYEGALPVLVRAVQALDGSGTLTEAYARYNLAFTRFALGSCAGVLGQLDRSEAIQGQRAEIDELRSEWSLRCAPPAEEDGNGNGKGNGKGKGRRGGDD